MQTERSATAADIITISLTQGLVAVVDAEDYADLAQFSWYAHREHCGALIYARRKVNFGGGRYGVEYMHRRILGTPKGFGSDHINHDGLDNRRVNLRIATRTQNNRNARLRKDSKSGAKGVSWITEVQRWRATIRVNSKTRHLGYFGTVAAAAQAYRQAAAEFYGEWACQ